MTDRSKTVVMLIDWDNLQICHSRDAPGTELDLQALIALAQSYGTLVSARAYAEWNLLSERLAVYKAGIEPVFAPVMRPEGSPREGKSLADTVMVADGVDLLWTVAPDVFVLATSDKDMIPLARIAKQRGAAVVVLGSDLTAIPLVEMSNVFITYRQLLRELDRVSELEAPVGRAPARERRLRESRRPSSEPYGGLGTNAMPPAPIGSNRPVGRPVGLAAPPAPIPAPLAPSRPPRRRFEEPIAPVPAPVPAPALEVERPLPVAVAPTPLQGDAPPASSDESGLGSGEIGPRRRRRRGGRGRRTGLGGLGDADIQTEALGDALDDSDEGDGTELDRSTTAASVTSPDDIDTAVLELLASRDRESNASTEPRGATPVETAPVSAFSVPAIERESEPAAPPAPRRIARTSFSSFGPPDVPIQRSVAPAPATPPTESAASGDLPSEQDAVESQPDPVTADAPEVTVADAPAPDLSEVIHDIAPDAVVQESVSAEPVTEEPFPQLTSVAEAEALVSSEPVAVEAAPEADEPARPARSGRTTRSGSTRRTRRPASDGGTTAESGSEASGDGESSSATSSDSTRTPRRRGVRRPAGVAASAAGDAGNGEAGAQV